MIEGGIIALIWLAGTWGRIYKQARFFQIEEYKNGRYLNWFVRDRWRVVPVRALMFGFVGIAYVSLREVADAPAVIILAVTALVAITPPPEGEIKKRFRRTGRAQRILAASFSMVTLVIVLMIATIDSITALASGGLLVFLLAPLFLVAGNIAMIPVESTFRARFIASARRILAGSQPTIIGITGSYGKTTTKNFVAGILNGRYRAYPTPKSYNTMMGICLAINTDLKDDYSIDYFIVEMGAYIRGEIQRICDLTPPHISIVTAVGPQHLERFGSVENIASAKYEIIKNLPPDGVGVFNWDNPYVREMYERGYPATRIGVSQTVAPDDPAAPRFVASAVVETLDGLRFTVHDRETGEQASFSTPVIGLHNVTNILLATAVAVHEGMTLADVAFAVRRLQPAESRLVRRTTPAGITIINDAYSANPEGIKSALRVLSLHEGGRRVLVTPGMVELGHLHEPENRRLGQLAAKHATDVILVGRALTAPIRDGLNASGFDAGRLQTVDELREAMAWIEANLSAGDTVLFLNDLPDTY